MAKRVLAVIGAIALVLAALVARSLIEGDDDEGGGGTQPGRGTVVACDPDLRRHCEVLPSNVEVRVEDSSVTSAAIVSGEADVAAWVTSSAWVELTAARQERTSEELGEPVPLASSPVGVHALADRAATLTEHCAGALAWHCVGDAAGRPWSDVGGSSRWGAVRIGMPDPDTALGLSALSAVAVGHFDGPDFAANDFSGFRDWLGRLAGPSGRGDRSLLRTLLRVRGTYDGAVLTRAEAAGQGELTAITDEPEVLARIVVVPVGDGPPDVATEELRASLVDAGWDAEAADAPVGPLLGPGVMGALHELWKDVAR